jgi:flagellar hook-associated protein 1 FlgK
MNLANLGLSALNAAQSRLQTAGHNINNASTDGYNRQSVLVSTAGGQNTGSGYFGLGVQVDTVQRSYDNFLFRQLVNSQSKGAEYESYGTEITQINNLVADRTVGISPALQKFFDGIQAVASSPADPAARRELLGRASSLVGQINDTNAFLDDQRGNLNTQVNTVVTQINSYLQRISDLNQRVVTAKAASAGNQPNDLLDQRDQLVSELNGLIGVKVIEQGDRFGLSTESGQVLLSSDTVYPLTTKPSSGDPSRIAVSYTMPVGPSDSTLVEIDDKYITGGKLGGLLQYRSQVLDPVQNDLGRMAVGLALSVNELHSAGYDQTGAAGTDFFSLSDPIVLGNQDNAGTGQFTAQYTDLSALKAQDYKVSFNGTTYTVSRQPEGTQVYEGNSFPVEFDGVKLDLTGTPVAGDSWTFSPTRNAAGDIGLAVTDPARIAAASTSSGDTDNGNALEMAKLQTKKILGSGTLSLNESFSQIVNNIGVLTQQNQTAQTAQQTLIQQNSAAQQSVSGVNLNEEYVNLDRFQEQFRAAARLIDVGSSLFDTLLGLRQ